ncbi:MAG: rRNA maturation RNase YbeY [Bacteroidales bacterium]|nr:rRNA maturation RNase YbeY [Bacteroidales bacterium]MDZ4205356.1 rRNA maturation RNase YbeY [Bacteroidales bacterium]
MITFQNLDISHRIKDKRAIAAWIKETIQVEGKTCKDLAVVLCSDSYLRELNQKYLKHNTLTDVITFSYSENPRMISGDLIISIERVQDNAKNLKVYLAEELNRVIIHGVLHLCGYDDKTTEQKLEIRAKEDSYLRKLIV